MLNDARKSEEERTTGPPPPLGERETASGGNGEPAGGARPAGDALLLSGDASENAASVLELFTIPWRNPTNATQGEIPRLQHAGAGPYGLSHVLAAQAEASIDGILIVDGQGEIIYANQRLAEAWGFPEATGLAGSDAPILQMAVEKVADPAGFLEKVEWLYQHPAETSRDEVPLKDGRVFDRYTAPIHGPDGEHAGRVWFFHDITRRVRAEADLLESRQSLEAIINSIADPVFVKGADRRFSLVNDAMCDLMGATRKAILGKCDADFFPPEQVEVFLRRDALVLETGAPDVNEEKITRADGEVRTIVTKKTLRTDIAGHPFIVGVIRDVTEHVQARRSQRMAQQRAQALLELFRLPRSSEAALVGFALDRLVALTESGLGFIGFVDPTESTMSAHVWSSRAMQECAMGESPTRFDVRTGGLWSAPVRQHRVVIVNDYGAPHPLKTGCPAGHVKLTRFLGVPLMKDGRAVLVAGLGNKAEPYGGGDEVEAILFLEGLWELIGRDRAEQGLTRSRIQLNDVGAMAGAGGWELDIATKELRWTRETHRIHDVPESETPDLAKAILFYDLPGRAVLEAAVKRCMESAEPFDLVLPFTSAKGRNLWVRAMGHPVEAGGRVVRLAGTFQDVTTRKQAEERISILAAAVEQSADDSVVIDLEGRIQYVNPAFERTTGYSAEEAMGRDVNDLLCRDLDKVLIPTIWESIRTGRPWKGRFSNRTKNGRVILLDGSVSVIRDPSGAIIGYVSSRRDVTKQVELEAHLIQVDKLEAIGTLAGGVAHDFNNVLSAIVGHTQLALGQCAHDPPVRRDLEVVLQGARRAADLVRQILTFSRHAPHEESQVQAGPIVKEVAKFLRATVPATIEIRTDVQSTSQVLADPADIHRIIVNLCTNAALAMGDRPGLLEIGLKDAEVDLPFAQRFPGLAPGRFLRLRVSDTGHGMGPEVVQRIFEPFFTTREVGRGTGMGLAVVHGIVTSLHGAITVETEVGRGTTFEIHLPAARMTVPEAPARSEETRGGGTERVLVVDDDALVLDTMVDMLRELGYRVQSVASGAAAQAAFEADPQAFDLVITDMTMPGIAGGALAGWLKDRRPDLPVILCSGYTEEQMPDSTAARGIDEFLTKPVFMGPLAQLLRKVLDGRCHRTHPAGPSGASTAGPPATPSA
jgi:PAS domain S-box-containing protein